MPKKVDRLTGNTHNCLLFKNRIKEPWVANSAQAKKRARQAEKSRQHNASMRSYMRTTIKNVVYAIDAGDKDAATAAYPAMACTVAAMCNKGIIHKNKAARYKSRLNAQIKAM